MRLLKSTMVLLCFILLCSCAKKVSEPKNDQSQIDKSSTVNSKKTAQADNYKVEKLPLEIQAKLDSKAAEFKACYEKYLKLSPELKGLIYVRLIINENGRVSDTISLKNTMQKEGVADCIQTILEQMRFENKDKQAEFILPFIFGE